MGFCECSQPLSIATNNNNNNGRLHPFALVIILSNSTFYVLGKVLELLLGRWQGEVPARVQVRGSREPHACVTQAPITSAFDHLHCAHAFLSLSLSLFRRTTSKAKKFSNCELMVEKFESELFK